MATTVFSGQWGFDVGEPTQTLAVADGWKTFISYQVFADTDSIDGGTGVLTVPATGIYHLHGTFLHDGAGTSGNCVSRWLANGTDELARGVSPNSNGTDQGTPAAQFVGCLEAGTTLEFQGFMLSGNTATVTYGRSSALRVPSPFTIMEMDPVYTPTYDAFEEYTPICDIPAWWDGGTPTRITVPDTGYYMLAHKNVQSGSPDTPNIWRDTQVFVNGSFVNIEVAYPGSPTNYPMNTVLSLTAGDYVEIFNDGMPAKTNELDEIDLAMFQFPGTFCGAHIYKSTQNVTNTFQNVTFNTAVYDTDGFWAGGTSAFLTVPSGKAGTYLVWTTDLKGGLRNVRSYLSVVSADPQQYTITGVDNYALGNQASSPHFTIWDLAVGDQVHLMVQNNDTGTAADTSYNLNMGMALIDGWTYTAQSGCPCPSAIRRGQIYRRL